MKLSKKTNALLAVLIIVVLALLGVVVYVFMLGGSLSFLGQGNGLPFGGIDFGQGWNTQPEGNDSYTPPSNPYITLTVSPNPISRLGWTTVSVVSNFPEEIMNKFNKDNRFCLQCSGCHGCR